MRNTNGFVAGPYDSGAVTVHGNRAPRGTRPAFFTDCPVRAGIRPIARPVGRGGTRTVLPLPKRAADRPVTVEGGAETAVYGVSGSARPAHADVRRKTFAEAWAPDAARITAAENEFRGGRDPVCVRRADTRYCGGKKEAARPAAFPKGGFIRPAGVPKEDRYSDKTAPFTRGAVFPSADGNIQRKEAAAYAGVQD